MGFIITKYRHMVPVQRYLKPILICSFILIIIFLSQLKSHGLPNESKIALSIRLRGPLPGDDPDVVEILKTSYLQGPSTKPYALSKDPLYKLVKTGYSWMFIALYLKNLFSEQSHGFFVEAGALDGEFYSNTLWLEKRLNWTGLLIEPDPYNYRDLLKKNRKAWTSNTCLSSESYPKETILISRRRTIDIEKNTTWIYRGSTHEIGVTLPPAYNEFMSYTTSDYVRAQCFPLWTYLLALNKTSIDLISLDIQGPEMEVIRTLPIEKLRVSVFVLEYLPSKRSDLQYLLTFFKNIGYKLIASSLERDYIFIRKDEERWKYIKEVSPIF